MRFTLSTANVCGRNRNCYYPHRKEITDLQSLRDAVAYDHVAAAYEGNRRANDKFLWSDCVVMDVDNDHSDNPVDWITGEVMARLFADVNYALATSRNHMKEKDGNAPRPKFHVYFPITPTEDASAYVALKEALYNRFIFFDGNALDAARFLFGAKSQVIWNEGKTNVDKWLRGEINASESEIASPGSGKSHSPEQHCASLREMLLPNAFSASKMDLNSAQGTACFASATMSDVVPSVSRGYAVIPQGHRNNTMHDIAARIMIRYGNTEEAKAKYLQQSLRCEPPLPEKELESVWRSSGNWYEKAVANNENYILPADYTAIATEHPLKLKPARYTDQDQVDLFVATLGHELKYTTATGFLSYDGICWVHSEERAKLTVRKFTDMQTEESERELALCKAKLDGFGLHYKSAAKGREITTHTPEQAVLANRYMEALEYHKQAKKYRSVNHRENVLSDSKNLVAVEPETLDANPYLLNTPIATYDLHAGTEAPKSHHPADNITKVTACDPGTQGADLWQNALDVFFCKDAELQEYVHQIVGMAALGKVFMEALIIAYGEGRNGKSTFWNAISGVLGSYSGNLSADVLTQGCRRNVKPEMAELKGKRLIIASELEEGTRLSTSLMKQLCSTDKIYAEKKFKDPFSFTPSHTVVLYTNHLPKVGANDEGTWRRLIVIPFNGVIESQSDVKNYGDYLVEHAGPAILQWIMEGARKAIACNFAPAMPDAVKNVMQGYRADNDWLGDFLEECTEKGEGFTCPSGQLYKTYRNYCAERGEYVRGNTAFYNAINRLGFAKEKKRGGAIIYGMQLVEEYRNLS